MIGGEALVEYWKEETNDIQKGRQEERRRDASFFMRDNSHNTSHWTSYDNFDITIR